MTSEIHEHGTHFTAVVLYLENIDSRIERMRWQLVGIAPPHLSAAVDDLAAIEAEIIVTCGHGERSGKHLTFRLADGLHHFVFGLRVPGGVQLPCNGTGMRVRNADDRCLNAITLARQIANPR